jgi:hypothetical protein
MSLNVSGESGEAHQCLPIVCGNPLRGVLFELADDAFLQRATFAVAPLPSADGCYVQGVDARAMPVVCASSCAVRARFSAVHLRAEGVFFTSGSFIRGQYPCEAASRNENSRRNAPPATVTYFGPTA